MRIMMALVLMIAALLSASAQDDAAPWQAAVSGQIQALRDGDAELALSYAGEEFRTQFEGQADTFYETIMTLGYIPIAASRSHSFGEFSKTSDNLVTQTVKFIGRDQLLYEAVYQLGDEGEGDWHVLGVVLKKSEGVAV